MKFDSGFGHNRYVEILKTTLKSTNQFAIITMKRKRSANNTQEQQDEIVGGQATGEKRRKVARTLPKSTRGARRSRFSDLIAGDDDSLLHRMLEFLDNEELAPVTLINKRFCTAARLCMDPTVDDNRAIMWASENNAIESVRWLLQNGRADPSAGGDYAIRYASEFGHHKVVRLLLQDERVDPSADHNYAIQMTCFWNQVKVVRLLLKDDRVDPTADENNAFYQAYMNRNDELISLLYEDERVRRTLRPASEGTIWDLRYPYAL